MRRIMARIQITPKLAIDEREIDEHFVLASGPGGQNVNKVATAVQIRFDVGHSPSLPDDLRARLIKLAGRRLTKDGVLQITAQRFRTQERNRSDARERLIELIKRASIRPKPRKKTMPSKAEKRRRLDEKTARSRLKQMRAAPKHE
jgi:ribosome-associated protein